MLNLFLKANCPFLGLLEFFMLLLLCKSSVPVFFNTSYMISTQTTTPLNPFIPAPFQQASPPVTLNPFLANPSPMVLMLLQWCLPPRSLHLNNSLVLPHTSLMSKMASFKKLPVLPPWINRSKTRLITSANCVKKSRSPTRLLRSGTIERKLSPITKWPNWTNTVVLTNNAASKLFLMLAMQLLMENVHKCFPNPKENAERKLTRLFVAKFFAVLAFLLGSLL